MILIWICRRETETLIQSSINCLFGIWLFHSCINILPDVQYSKYNRASRSGNWSVDFYVVDWCSFFFFFFFVSLFSQILSFIQKQHRIIDPYAHRLSLKCPATRARALERLIRCRRNPSTYFYSRLSEETKAQQLTTE